MVPSKLPEAHAKAEKNINGFINSCVEELHRLKVRHDKHIEQHMNSYREFEQLRQKLINGEPLIAYEATGNTIAKMLKEIKETDSLGSPYCL
jgi:hypothetical protein